MNAKKLDVVETNLRKHVEHTRAAYYQAEQAYEQNETPHAAAWVKQTEDAYNRALEQLQKAGFEE